MWVTTKQHARQTSHTTQHNEEKKRFAYNSTPEETWLHCSHCRHSTTKERVHKTRDFSEPDVEILQSHVYIIANIPCRFQNLQEFHSDTWRDCSHRRHSTTEIIQGDTKPNTSETWGPTAEHARPNVVDNSTYWKKRFASTAFYKQLKTEAIADTVQLW